MIDDTAFQAAANTCDEAVTVPDGAGGTTTQARYTCDGVVNVDQTPHGQPEGAAHELPRLPGVLGRQVQAEDRQGRDAGLVRAERRTTSSAAGRSSSAASGTASTACARASSTRTRAGSPTTRCGPTPRRQTHATWLAAGREPGARADARPAVHAQRLHRAQIARSRRSAAASARWCRLTATIAATCLEVGDVVPVSHATPGWPAAGDPAEGKLFRVIEMELLSRRGAPHAPRVQRGSPTTSASRSRTRSRRAPPGCRSRIPWWARRSRRRMSPASR
jgi:hypothetical protein